MRFLREPLLLFSAANAFECVSDNGRFLVGIGEGKIVSNGTDVGLSGPARKLLEALAKRSIGQNFSGALRFIQVEDEFAVECSQQALLTTDAGDLLFFLVSGRAGCEALKTALNALLTPAG